MYIVYFYICIYMHNDMYKHTQVEFTYTCKLL